MTRRISDNAFMRAAGTAFLLAGAFFIGATFLSMRAVFADPIQQVSYAQTSESNAPGGVSAANRRRSSSTTGAAAKTNSVNQNSSRGVKGASSSNRGVVSRTNTAAGTTSAQGSRSTARTVINRSPARTSTNLSSRTVRARSGDSVNTSRVSLTGSAMRASTGTVSGTLASKLTTATYSNIIDPTTGLISSDAYSNCMNSYYTCMDEICTARSPGQRRCACAGRVLEFAKAEQALQSAREELLKVSGDISLFIATKGKDISVAFQLTDAEKVLNCVSYRNASKNGTLLEWCKEHTSITGILPASCTANISAPSYCTSNDLGWGGTDWMDALNGADSDILASLQAYADASSEAISTISSNDDALVSAYDSINSIVSSLNGSSSITWGDTSTTVDTLAQTWGYNLFAYAHNNVCNRVLDSCFNGIYEACGTPPSGVRTGNGATTGPYNYNSVITVTNEKDVNFTIASTGSTTSTTSATCYGYTSTSGDPYSSLRKPVADARRSILQKYVLDANSDCDVYGEELKTQTLNIGYQKIAAEQLLQKKRLEFEQDAEATTLSDAVTAGTNFNTCISEIYDCYNAEVTSNPSWSTARIKTYCAQIAEVPHCYDTMICNPSSSQFKAVIDVEDSASCSNTQDKDTNTCRNVVTLNEILNGTGVTAVNPSGVSSGNSSAFREWCLTESIGTDDGSIRGWTKPL